MSKRKRNYVDNHVQGALIRRVTLHWFCFFVVAGCSVLGMQLLLGDASQTFGERIAEKSRDLCIYGVVILVLFPAFLFDTIKFSNRFAGPVSRLHQAMSELANTGETPDLIFRAGDFWADLAAEFNKIKDQLGAAVDQRETETTSLHEEVNV